MSLHTAQQSVPVRKQEALLSLGLRGLGVEV